MRLIAPNITTYRALVMPSGLGLADPQIALDGRCMTGHGFSSEDIAYGEANGAAFVEELPNDFVVPQTQQSTEEQQAQLIATLTGAVQIMLDTEARKKGYDGILSAASYAALPAGKPFKTEGTAYAVWRSDVWTKCYAIMDLVQRGQHVVPTPENLVAEVLTACPAPY